MAGSLSKTLGVTEFEHIHTDGPIEKYIKDFAVLCGYIEDKRWWIYCTSGAALLPRNFQTSNYEYFMLSATRDAEKLEIPRLVAFRSIDRYINYGDILQLNSEPAAGMNYICISIPYPLPPDACEIAVERRNVSLKWILKIHADEAAFAEANGIEALEQLFDAAGMNFLDDSRPSVVASSPTTSAS